MRKFIYASMGNWEEIEKRFEEQERKGYKLKKINGFFAYFEKEEAIPHRYVFVCVDLHKTFRGMNELNWELREYSKKIPTRLFSYNLYQVPIEREKEVDEIKRRRRQKHFIPYLRNTFFAHCKMKLQ